MRALVIGESLIDVVERGHERATDTERGHERAADTERGHERATNTERGAQVTAEHVGGSPLNVAVGLARLGREVDFLTRIGADDYGHRIRDFVESAGVRLVAGSEVPGRTATARAVLDDAGSASYTFDIDWQLSGTPPVPPPVVVHTGSIATVLEPGCLATAALVDTYRPSATVTFDPNIRAALITDADAARERIDRMLEKADVVKVSDEDLRWIDPSRSPEQIGAAWLALGVSIVVVTFGGDGALAMCAAGNVRVPAPRVDVVDTVGAGDAFMTGLVDALWSRDLLGADRRPTLSRIDVDALTGAVRAATLCAAVTVSRAGADLPDRDALDAAGSSEILG